MAEDHARMGSNWVGRVAMEQMILALIPALSMEVSKEDVVPSV